MIVVVLCVNVDCLLVAEIEDAELEALENVF